MTHAKYSGSLAIDPPLNADEVKALSAFFRSRRILTTGGPLDCRNLPNFHSEVIDMTRQPEGQPGEWCDLEVSADGTKLLWKEDSGTDRDLHEWIIYVINYLLKDGAQYSFRDRDLDMSLVPDGNLLWSFTFNHAVNGEMTGTAAEKDGVWRITVKDNVVTTAPVVLELAAKAVEEED